jgi:hypothetical protein
MDGLTTGRIVYFVFDEQSAKEVMRRRTDGAAIATRMKQDPPLWPAGAQAHIGNPVTAGAICPAMVVAVAGGDVVNLKVMLDGADEYWATSVHYDADQLQRSWHWMFAGQSGRYTPDSAKPPSTPAPEGHPV